MSSIQEEMLNEFKEKERSYYFRNRLKRAAEEGLLIFIKWALVITLAYVALQYGTGIISGASNGTNSALYLNELISKGYLPKAVNGVIQPMTNGEQNATPVIK